MVRSHAIIKRLKTKPFTTSKTKANAMAPASTPLTGAKGRVQEPDAGRGPCGRTRRRPDHGQAHASPRQQRINRRPEGRNRGRLARRPPLEYREYLQDLRRELQKPVPPRSDRAGSAEDRNAIAGGQFVIRVPEETLHFTLALAKVFDCRTIPKYGEIAPLQEPHA